MVGEHGVEAGEELGEGGGPPEIEHELVSGEHRLVTVGGEGPLGVRPVQVAVGVHHLRLDPESELHAERPPSLVAGVLVVFLGDFSQKEFALWGDSKQA